MPCRLVARGCTDCLDKEKWGKQTVEAYYCSETGQTYYDYGPCGSC